VGQQHQVAALEIRKDGLEAPVIDRRSSIMT
jgi:hypothetical protein